MYFLMLIPACAHMPSSWKIMLIPEKADVKAINTAFSFPEKILLSEIPDVISRIAVTIAVITSFPADNVQSISALMPART